MSGRCASHYRITLEGRVTNGWGRHTPALRILHWPAAGRGGQLVPSSRVSSWGFRPPRGAIQSSNPAAPVWRQSWVLSRFTVLLNGVLRMKRILLTAIVAALAVGALIAGEQGQGGGGAMTADALKAIELRSIGPTIAPGAIVDIDDRPEERQRLVRRHGVRRAVEDGESRHHASSRSSTTVRLVHAVLRRRRPEGLERRLARHGRERAASAARTSATASTSRPTPARPGRASVSRPPSTSATSSIDPRDSERRLRGRAGPALVVRRRARPLQDDRRRRDLGRRSSPSATTPASATWCSTRRTRQCSTPRPTSGAAPSGR